MQERISAGADILDDLLCGGYETDVVTTIFGPAGSGKSTFTILAAIKTEKKSIIIDTEGSFSVERLMQITPDYKNALSRILFMRPVTFEEQKLVFERLLRLINDKIGLIVLDSVAMLYRVEVGRTKDVHNVNKELGQQIAFLTEIARKRSIPVIITNQVYADFEEKDRIQMVGGDILRYASKCLIELQKEDDGIRKAIIKKHRSIEEGKSVRFKLVNSGIEPV